MAGKRLIKKDDYSERQIGYVQYRVRGLTPYAAAKMIGDPSHSSDLEKWMTGTAKGEALYHREKELSENRVRLSRSVVADGFLEAAEMARALRDPTAMVSAYREVGRMFGMYEPEQREIHLTGTVDLVRKEIQQLSDEALIELVNKGSQPNVIDAEVIDAQIDKV